MHVKKFNVYTNLSLRELRFFLHQMEHVKNIPTHVIAKVRSLKKKYDKRLTLTDKELEIVEEFGKGSNFILNCIIYMDKGDSHGDRKSNTYQSREAEAGATE